MILNLGEVVVSYAKDGMDTGSVAEILEERFGVMQIFADQNANFIAEQIERGIADTIENINMGAPISMDMFGGAAAKIENRFHEFIDNGEHGIRTKEMKSETMKTGARKKRQYRKVQAKTAFWETGAYYRNFKVWVE